MKKSKVTATIALIAVSASTLALVAGPASAWTHRRHVGFPPFSALNFYSSPRHPSATTVAVGTAIARASAESP